MERATPRRISPLVALSPTGLLAGFLLAGFLLAGLLLSSCASTSAPSAPPVPVEGVTWRAVSVAGRPVPPIEAPTLLIEGGQISGRSGCNDYGGDVQVVDGSLVVGELAMTAAACVDPVANERERQFVAVLTGSPAVVLGDGQMILRGPAGEVVLRPAQAFE